MYMYMYMKFSCETRSGKGSVKLDVFVFESTQLASYSWRGVHDGLAESAFYIKIRAQRLMVKAAAET